MSESNLRIRNERLRAAVLDSGMTVEMVAAKAGVDRKTLERWIGGRVPHPRNRHALADALGVSSSTLWPEADPDLPFVGSELTGLTAAYASRSLFLRDFPPERLFTGADSITMAGLSNNLLCQQFSDQRLEQLLCRGSSIACLFLDPAGAGTAAREAEEHYAPGHLAGLTTLNISLLQRLRARLPASVQERLWLGTYDETIRFNIVVVERANDTIGVVQPYLPHSRGVDSPTLILRPSAELGLFETFSNLLAQLQLKATPC